jgi:hypothetical protein
LVAVDDPLGVHKPVEDRPIPLLLGTFVRVEIVGQTLPKVAALPREAVVDDAVWVVDRNQRIQRRVVKVIWRERGRVFVSEGLEAGERVAVTPLGTVTEGTMVAIEHQLSAADEPS